MHRNYYRFGGLTFCLTAPTAFQESKLCRDFRTEAAPADHTIQVAYANQLLPVPTHATSNGPLSRWYDQQGQHTLRCYSTPPRTLQFSYAVVGERETRLTFSESYQTCLSSRAIFESAGLFDILAQYRQLVLHASYICTRQGQAILFSAPSGVGKSTQAALWAQYAGAQVVNGDRALIRVEDGTANGIFYAGTSGISRDRTAPIRAIILLHQGRENRLQPARPKDAFAALLSQSAYYPWDVPSTVQMTELVAQLVSTVPVLEMDCLPDASAVQALENELRRG